MKYCPRCRSEYYDEYSQCHDCDLPLVRQLPPLTEQQDHSDGQLVPVFRSPNQVHVQSITALLEGSEIPVHLSGAANVYRLNVGEMGMVELSVPASQAERAQEIIRTAQEGKLELEEIDPNCIFCQIVEGTSPAEKFYEDDYVIAFMDVFPATDGHCLIASKVHAKNLFDLPEESAVAAMKATLKIAPAVMEVVEADGLNILQSNGKAAWQSVDHFHMHLIPRYTGDGFRPPFSPKPGDPSDMKNVSQLIKNAL